ncbi:hypothetical protein [Spirosoma radiotolerans]|uniref:Uncharacterized protein n=1 Tax=Spirosoma radiotolerans TaxID=1379870 RepID=A0A0E3V5N9_9BACT|nr:hypothetical protein [Spirosoma radiotolerans]AKD53791.1 hypothetical protein SD10_01615 [Spirosoma radiotolerans]
MLPSLGAAGTMYLKDYIDLLLKALTFLVTAGLAFKAIHEYIRAQRWKRFEFLGQQIKDFSTDIQVRKVTTMLDWDKGQIELFPGRSEDKFFTVDEAMVTASLYPLGSGINGEGFSDEEAKVRELFDAFFDKLTMFGIYIKSGLVAKQDLKPYIYYWLEMLADPSKRGQEFVNNVYGFLETYGYNIVLELLDEYGFTRPNQIIPKPKV